MSTIYKSSSIDEIARLLRERGINPTSQRVLITQALLERKTHLTADDVFRVVNEGGPNVSKATVYNTLGLLARQGVIREVIADPSCVFYDPNTLPHHHFYYEDSRELADINAHEVKVERLPPMPEGTDLCGVDVVIRVRRHR